MKKVVKYNQSHYIEVAQGDIFIDNVIWVGFGPIGNTEKKFWGQ